MSIDSHLNELVRRHQAIEEAISDEESHPGSDDIKIHELKVKKLHIKDEIEKRVVRRSGPPVRCETNVTARFTPIHTDLSLKGEERRLIPSLFGSQPCTPETPEKRCDNRLLEVTFIKAKLLSSDSEAQEAFILERSGTRVIDEAGRIVNGR